MVRLLAILSLLAVTAVWGATFVMVHDAVAHFGVMGFLAMRFALAAAVTALVWGWRLNLRSLRVGMGIGLVLAAGYLLQTWGLRFTTATNSGLLTGLFVICGPLADRLIFGSRLHRSAWLAVGLSLLGMSLLIGRGPTGLTGGDVLTLGCAAAFGIHIALLSRHAPHHDPGALGAAQMAAAALVFLALWPLTERVQVPPRSVWGAILITGVLASAVAYFVQTTAQRHLTTVQTAVILTTEPVFAALFGYLLAGERLLGLQYLGAALIIAALLVAELVPRRRGPRLAAD